MALMAAEKAHSNQTYDIFPYMYHIRKTLAVAQELGYDETIQVACVLHDSMEDDSLSYNKIKTFFGETVAEIVFAVTDELGRNRVERKAKTYPKIVKNWRAIVVKICDRIANLEQSANFNPSKCKMYLQEHQDFVDQLTNKNDVFYNEIAPAWRRLDALVNYISTNNE